MATNPASVATCQREDVCVPAPTGAVLNALPWRVVALDTPIAPLIGDTIEGVTTPVTPIPILILRVELFLLIVKTATPLTPEGSTTVSVSSFNDTVPTEISTVYTLNES